MEEEHIKVLSNENIGESKLVSSIHFDKLSGRQVFFPAPNGRHHERSINIFSVLSTL
jgi:hypothetical protein